MNAEVNAEVSPDPSAAAADKEPAPPTPQGELLAIAEACGHGAGGIGLMVVINSAKPVEHEHRVAGPDGKPQLRKFLLEVKAQVKAGVGLVPDSFPDGAGITFHARLEYRDVLLPGAELALETVIARPGVAPKAVLKRVEDLFRACLKQAEVKRGHAQKMREARVRRSQAESVLKAAGGRNAATEEQREQADLADQESRQFETLMIEAQKELDRMKKSLPEAMRFDARLG